jgi:hypothetical protein
MSGSCPYCGAKLNYGIKFCVVCGRPIAGPDTGKVGSGMRSGIRPADVTRRLDDLMTVARFRRSKRSTNIDRTMRWFSLNAMSIVVGVCLFFCAIKLSLDGGLISKHDRMIQPFEQILTQISNIAKGESKDAKDAKDKGKSGAKGDKKIADEPAPAPTKKKSKSRNRSGHRSDHG